MATASRSASRGVCYRGGKGRRLQGFAHDVQLGELGGGESGDGVTEVRLVGHEALCGKGFEAFAHGDGADAEDLGDLIDRYRRARRDAAVEDHPAEFVDDGALRVVGLAANESGEQRGMSTARH